MYKWLLMKSFQFYCILNNQATPRKRPSDRKPAFWWFHGFVLCSASAWYWIGLCCNRFVFAKFMLSSASSRDPLSFVQLVKATAYCIFSGTTNKIYVRRHISIVSFSNQVMLLRYSNEISCLELSPAFLVVWWSWEPFTSSTLPTERLRVQSTAS